MLPDRWPCFSWVPCKGKTHMPMLTWETERNLQIPGNWRNVLTNWYAYILLDPFWPEQSVKKKKIHMRQLEKSENCIWWYYNIGCDNSSCFQMNSWLFWAANRNIYKWNDKIAGFPLKIIWCGWGIEKPERPQAGDCWSWEAGAGSCESRSCFLSP